MNLLRRKNKLKATGLLYKKNKLKISIDAHIASYEKHDSRIEKRIVESWRDGLKFLNRLPEEDTFWCCEPSFEECQKYFKKSLIRNPNNEAASWILIADELIDCSGIGSRYLEPLIERNPHQIYWLVAGTVWVLERSGADMSYLLRKSLERLKNKINEFDKLLEDLLTTSDPYIKIMVELAIAVLRGEDIINILHHYYSGLKPLA